ncbi:MAG: dephospho-CoA kinase [Oscillospiraceae bacterium]|nr:dephospho-CoA kinase [Oscillospiraceae bacterium]
MKIFGITGGSGSGKTSVSAIFRELGAEIIDTDIVAREVVRKGSKCLDELVECFGAMILNPDGTLDRKKLAKEAFSDREKTAALNRITHKYIKEEVMQRIKNSTSDLIGIDGAVIIGSNIEELCEFIVYVTADERTRIKRIKKRDMLTDEEAYERLGAQPDDDFYTRNSRYVIDNSGSLNDLKVNAQKLYDKIKGE